MEDRKKYRILLLIIVILVLFCMVLGFLVLRDSDFKFAWGVNKEKDFDQFSYSLLDKFKNDQEERWDRFDRFFDEDFFKNRDDPFQEMEHMQRRMQEMMKKEFQKSFQDSWDGWFSRRFHRKGDDIKIQTKEKKDSFVITIDIPNLKQNKLNVNVDSNGIHIEAEVEQIVEKKDSYGNIITSRKVHRKIDQTYPIPRNADYQSAQMKYKNDKVIITLSKLSG